MSEWDEDLLDDEPVSKVPAKSKTPISGPSGTGDKVNVFLQSTIGPGEKKQKLLVNTGNNVGALKNTCGNLFGLNPDDFHLSHDGVTMDEGDPLVNYSVKDGDTLLLIPASTAG